MTKSTPNQYTYKSYVAYYAVRYLSCPECGAKPHESCTMNPTATTGVVCRSRWLAARAEVADDAARRPYKRRTAPKPSVATSQCPVCSVPSDGWCESCRKRAFAPGRSPEWQYRKLRKFLASYGITMAKDYGTGRYLLDHNGRHVTGPVPLDAVIGAVEKYWRDVLANSE
jgi:hypothetical protein